MQIAGLAAWAAARPDTVPVHAGKVLYANNPKLVDVASMQCFAALAAVTALVYCHQRGHTFTPAEEHRTVPENVLQMMGFVDTSTNEPDPSVVQHLDKLWILYADHEMSLSTAALLHTASAGADPLSCSISAIAAAAGPLHGGAIDIAYKMFEKVGSPVNVESLMEMVRRKECRLMGVGHRIYKTEDPRGRLLRARLEELRSKTETDPLLAVAFEIDRVVRNDQYFTKRKLCINADLYGCLVFTAL
jgi:citrate synthase